MSTREERRIAARKRFMEAVVGLGGTCVGEYVNIRTRVEILCPDGHTSFPLPNTVTSGSGGICRSCAGQDSVGAAKAFHERVAELGGTVLGDYSGTHRPVPVMCQYGHTCAPTPGNVRRGQGICTTCACKAWDIFYVVQDPTLGWVKFGITSGSARPRLKDHARNGFTSVLVMHTDLPEGLALETERKCLAAMRSGGWSPVRGREYFDSTATDTVMQVASTLNEPVR